MATRVLARGGPNAWQFMNQVHPGEVHNAGGTCPNPKCDYVLTQQDEDDIHRDRGWWECPNCHMEFNMLDPAYNAPSGGQTRAFGITPSQLGQIGEQIIIQMGEVPGVGKVLQHFSDTYHSAVDLQIGPYGCEVKTIHSESSTPRFKLVGGGGRNRATAIQLANEFCEQNNLRPALIGVRLNFYTDLADIFFREGLQDTWIGSSNLQHVGSVNFKNLNPYRSPEDVPPPEQLPNDDSDIPF